MTTDDVIEQQATGSDLFALPNAAVRSSSCAPATKPLVFSLSRVLEGRRPQAALCFPSYGHVLVKTALSVWRFVHLSGNLTASFVTLERQRQ
jgi:hypothetical protein